MKTVELSVLTAMTAGLVVAVFMLIMPAAKGVAGQVGVSQCEDGAFTPAAIECGAMFGTN